MAREYLITKSDEEKRLAFGWASISVTADGETVTDFQEDQIDIEELENAVYKYVLNFREAGEMHEKMSVGKLVESCVFTKEKAVAIGINEREIPEGWWVGFKVEDNDVWEKIKNGTYRMFFIGVKAKREEMD